MSSRTTGGRAARTPGKTRALSDDPANIARIARRYPPRPVRTLVLRVVLVAAIVAALAWYLPMAHRNANPPVTGVLSAHWVVSNQEAGFTLLVGRPDPRVPAVCTVRAQAANYEYVGQVDVPIPPSDQRQVSITSTMRTVREADAVALEGCRIR